MELLPTAIRIILNIVFYCVYVVIVVFLTGIILGQFFDMHLAASEANAQKITYVLMILTLIVTFLYRKFFYIGLQKKG